MPKPDLGTIPEGPMCIGVFSDRLLDHDDLRAITRAVNRFRAQENRRARLRAVVRTVLVWAAVLLVGTGGAGFWYLGYHVHQVPWCHAAGWVAIGLGIGAGVLAMMRGGTDGAS